MTSNQKILIIDNLFSPNIKGNIANGAQKFARNQVNLLSGEFETHYVTAAGSDPQWANQYILKEFFDLSLTTREKVEQTKRIAEEIRGIVNSGDFDFVLDNSCKHMSSVWDSYNVGIIFEHYHSPSAPLNDKVREKFDRKQVSWVGVSKWQAEKRFRNLFDDTICIHYINERPEEIKPAQDYGVFVGRWDGGKYPHVALKNYLKSGANIPLKCFIKFGGLEIPKKELDNLMASPLLEFHIDAPRDQILEAISGAAFGLGMGNESTGIVCLEYASFGVPYIVPGNQRVAEMEHLPAEALFLADRSLDLSLPDQVRLHVNQTLTWTYEQRKQLSEKVLSLYDKDHFVDRHIKLLVRAAARKVRSEHAKLPF